MSSTFKTAILGLNSWIDTDKPTRSDFISDNVIIDHSLGNHLNDTVLHLTEKEKIQVNEPYYFKIVQGTDEATRTIDLDFSPRIVIYYAIEKPSVELTDGTTTVNNGISVNGYDSSGGIIISDKQVIITHGTVDGVVYNLNNAESQYMLVAFR